MSAMRCKKKVNTIVLTLVLVKIVMAQDVVIMAVIVTLSQLHRDVLQQIDKVLKHDDLVSDRTPCVLVFCI